jgi:tRNA A37 threonylcarbamoyladenosine dehydratase
MTQEEFHRRTQMLVGEEAMQRLIAARVIVFGVGGVGSWCVESLVRSGIVRVTIVDSDCVSPTNVNRQLMATVPNEGRPKVEALRERLLDINPEAQITAIQGVYDETTASQYDLNGYDYVVDAIDTVKAKILLIQNATASSAKLFSSMGAALKMDPARIEVSEFWKVNGCPLARALRNVLKRPGMRPRKKFLCVWSPELLPNLGDTAMLESEAGAIKQKANGTVAHITAIFGFTLAGLIVKDITILK